MSEAIKAMISERARRWWTLITYVLADIALVSTAWLQAAPDDAHAVGWKGWSLLAATMVASVCKQVRSVMSNEWNEGKN